MSRTVYLKISITSFLNIVPEKLVKMVLPTIIY